MTDKHFKAVRVLRPDGRLVEGMPDALVRRAIDLCRSRGDEYCSVSDAITQIRDGLEDIGYKTEVEWTHRYSNDRSGKFRAEQVDDYVAAKLPVITQWWGRSSWGFHPIRTEAAKCLRQVKAKTHHADGPGEFLTIDKSEPFPAFPKVKKHLRSVAWEFKLESNNRAMAWFIKDYDIRTYGEFWYWYRRALRVKKTIDQKSGGHLVVGDGAALRSLRNLTLLVEAWVKEGEPMGDEHERWQARENRRLAKEQQDKEI